MGGGGGSSSSSSLWFKTQFRFFGALMVLGFILFMLVGYLQSEGNKTKTTVTTDHQSLSSMGKLQRQEHVNVLGTGKSSVVHPRLDLNYMSKRRVPNGPDPIHNRRAGNSRRRPGQA